MEQLKANDIRVGNWVHTGEFHIKECQGEHQVEYDWFEYANMFKPIPLTTEWLKKFGFFAKYKHCNFRWNIGGFDIQQETDEDENGNKIPQEEIFYYQYMYEIKWVHQLQNLYFALTGKELTIKQQNNEK